jgi:small-conductance mechanosensitive channel
MADRPPDSAPLDDDTEDLPTTAQLFMLHLSRLLGGLLIVAGIVGGIELAWSGRVALGMGAALAAVFLGFQAQVLHLIAELLIEQKERLQTDEDAG